MVPIRVAFAYTVRGIESGGPRGGRICLHCEGYSEWWFLRDIFGFLVSVMLLYYTALNFALGGDCGFFCFLFAVVLPWGEC